MAKKKDKPQVINNIQELNLEIDYDKLAEAIVAANQKREHRPRNTKIRGFVLGMCNGILYSGLCFIVLNNIVKMWMGYAKSGTPNLCMCILVSIVGVAIAILLFLAQQETTNDTDEEVFSHFNTTVAFAALIVALVALFKGVG